jgi:2-oxoglutarate ferredoxin oxidoreductase subunit beta
VFRDVTRPTYDALVAEQLERAVATQGAGDLTTLLHGNDTWRVDPASGRPTDHGYPHRQLSHAT